MTDPARPGRPAFLESRGFLWPLLLLSSALSFARLGAPLSNPDEGLFAEVAREMAETNDGVTPRCNEARYPDKPPLLAWLTAGLYKVAGRSESTARFWPAAFGVASVAAVFFLGRVLFGPLAGSLAGLVQATSAGTVVFSRFLLLDQIVSALLALTLLGAWQMAHAATPGRRRGWAAAAGAFVGASVLTKGMLGLALPLGVVALACLLGGRPLRSRFAAAPLGIFLIAFCAVALPWHLMALIRDPELLRILFWNEQIARFFDRREPHDYESLPVPLFLLVALAWTFPWTFCLPLAARKEADPSDDAGPLRFVIAWLAVTLGFFCLSGCRLPHYSLPALPALALGVGRGWARLTLRPTPLGRRLAAVGAALLAATGTALLVFLKLGHAAVHRFIESESVIRGGVVASLALAVAGGAAALFVWRGFPLRAFSAVAAGALVLAVACDAGLSVYQGLHSFKDLARAVAPLLQEGDVDVVLEHPAEYESIGGLCFYLESRVRVLERAGRPTSPYPHGPAERFFITEDEFRVLCRSERRICYITEPGAADPVFHPPVEGLQFAGEVGGRRVYAHRPVLAGSH